MTRKILIIATIIFSIFFATEALACKKTITMQYDKTFAEQVVTPNVTYIIPYNYDLGGKEIVLPKGCTLKFNGGSIRNGVLIGDKTRIEAPKVKIIEPTLTAKGTWNVKELWSEWFGAKGDGNDETSVLTAFFNIKIADREIVDLLSLEDLLGFINKVVDIGYSHISIEKIKTVISILKEVEDHLIRNCLYKKI